MKEQQFVNISRLIDGKLTVYMQCTVPNIIDVQYCMYANLKSRNNVCNINVILISLLAIVSFLRGSEGKMNWATGDGLPDVVHWKYTGLRYYVGTSFVGISR